MRLWSFAGEIVPLGVFFAVNAIYGLFAITLLCGQAMGVSVMRAFFGAQFNLSERTWRLLSLRWGVFFAVLAVGNEIAWRSLSDDGWVAVKVFVFAPLTGLFALSQLPLTLRGRLSGVD